MNKIMRLIIAFSTIAILLALVSGSASAIRRAGGMGWDATTMYGSLFDPTSIVTISGEVISVNHFTPFRRMGPGYLVVVRTSNETIPVHVGPAWYVEPLGFRIDPGDQVRVIGSRIEFNAEPAIMPMTVLKEGQVLELRDSNGIPVWSGLYVPAED